MMLFDPEAVLSLNC